MENITMQDRNREAVREELLKHLQKLEEDGWMIFGWNHMNLTKIRWLRNPPKLIDCDYYRHFIKSWLREDRLVVPLRTSPNGRVKYSGGGLGSKAFVDSIYFQLWLAKGAQICLVSYGEHKFGNKVFEETLGRANFNIVFFENWLYIISRILSKKEERG